MADVRGHFTHTPRPQLHAGPPLPGAAPGPATVPGRRGWPWPHGTFGSAGRDRARGRWGLLKACALGLSPGSTGSGSRRPRRQAWAGRVRRRKGEDARQTPGRPAHPFPAAGPGGRGPRTSSATPHRRGAAGSWATRPGEVNRRCRRPRHFRCFGTQQRTSDTELCAENRRL